MKTVIEMAQKAGFPERRSFSDLSDLYPRLERFAELVRADERNRTWTQEHWTEYEHSIVAAEREACAKVCEEFSMTPANMSQAWRNGCRESATEIRERRKS